jgi:SAM-dependent methyltransferase
VTADEGGDAACWAHLVDDDAPPSEAASRLRDRLPLGSYGGLSAEAYDAWIPVDAAFPDDEAMEHVVATAGGTSLELGCGTGRPLLRWLEAGHDVEGVDASADMLTILRRNAAERGLDPVVHHGDIAPLDLGRTYAAIVCPAGTFTLLDDEARIRAALASYLEHLQPGGRLALTLSRLPPTGEDSLRWRIRRTGTLADGTTVVVHEALLKEDGHRCQVVYNRLEAFDPDGRLRDTWLRRLRLRSWEQPEIHALLERTGFVDVREWGDPDGWVSVARRPR